MWRSDEEAAFAVGLEGGLMEDNVYLAHGVGSNHMSCFAWMAIVHIPSRNWGTNEKIL